MHDLHTNAVSPQCLSIPLLRVKELQIENIWEHFSCVLNTHKHFLVINPYIIQHSHLQSICFELGIVDRLEGMYTPREDYTGFVQQYFA